MSRNNGALIRATCCSLDQYMELSISYYPETTYVEVRSLAHSEAFTYSEELPKLLSLEVTGEMVRDESCF